MKAVYATPNLTVANCIRFKDATEPTKLSVGKMSGCLKRATFIIEGLPQGKAHTLGNSLRRNLLQFIPGMAPVAMKIVGADHEYSPISGLVNDTNDLAMIIKNLKIAMVSKLDKDTMPTSAVFEIDKTYSNEPIYFKDFKPADKYSEDFDYSILNPEQQLTFVGKENIPVFIQVLFKRGVGYSGYNVVNKEDDVDVDFRKGAIFLDSLFSPVVDASFTVHMQTPSKTTETLEIMVETDGSILPSEAIQQAIQVSISDYKMMYDLFNAVTTTRQQAVSMNQIVSDAQNSAVQEFATIDESVSNTDYARPNVLNEQSEIEALGLPTAIYDALKDNYMNTVADLKKNWQIIEHKDEIRELLRQANITTEDIDEPFYK